MTDSQLFRHLQKIRYSPNDRMDLSHDERTWNTEDDILRELKARGYTMDAIKALRNGLDK